MYQVSDHFSGINRHPHWNRLATGGAWVEELSGLHLTLRGAQAGTLSVAQIDDYLNRPRSEYLWTPPLTLRMRARVTLPSSRLLGTAGFGFWNNMAPLWSDHMEVMPNWIWFNFASAQSTFSITNGPPNGWKASIVTGGRGGEKTLSWSKTLQQVPILGRAANRVRLPAREAGLEHWDFTAWHDFEIHWLREMIHLRIDGEEVLEARIRQPIPLAFVAWMDNNFASVRSNGEMELGNLAVAEEQSLLIDGLEIIRDRGE